MDTTFIESGVCEGESATETIEVLSSAEGCDSIVLTSYFVWPIDTVEVLVQTNDPSELGVDTLNLESINNCDSIVIVTTVLEGIVPDTNFITQFVCNQDEVGVDTILIDATLIEVITAEYAGSTPIVQTEVACDENRPTDTLFLMNSQGCDSLIITEYDFRGIEETFLTDFSCLMEELGLDTLTLEDQNGCDSLVITETFLSEADTMYAQELMCGISASFFDTLVMNIDDCPTYLITEMLVGDSPPTIRTSGTCLQNVQNDTLFLLNANGCDSLVITEYEFEALPPTIIEEITCFEDEAGEQSTVFASSEGCDSLVIVNIIYNEQVDTAFNVVNVCNAESAGIDTVFIEDEDCPFIEITESFFESVYDTSYQELMSCDDDLIGTELIENFPSLNGCDSIVVTTFVEGDGEISLAFEIDTEDVSCFGARDGSVMINAISDELQINWQDGFESFDRGDLAAGEYFVTISSGSCESLEKIVIGGPDQMLTNITVVNGNCQINAGAASVEVSGGTAPYEYLWSNGETTSEISNLENGIYELLITDAEACTESAQIAIMNDPVIALDVFMEPVRCHGESSGFIIVRPQSGRPPFDFNWSNGADQQNLIEVPAGSYELTVSDANDCVFIETYELTEPDVLDVEIVENDGMLTAEIMGGNPPYRYFWSNGSQAPSIVVEESGNYSLIITDILSCTDDDQYIFTSLTNPEFSTVEMVPNPNQGSFFLMGLEQLAGPITLEIYDLRGCLIQSQEYFNGKMIHVENAPAGVHILRLSNKKGSFTLLFVIQ